MDTGALVVVSASSPREKFWGVLLALNPTGITFRGLALDSFEDWLRQHMADGPQLLGPVTIFLPAHRIDRVELDESGGAVEGLGDRFRRLTGKDPVEEVRRGDQPSPGDRLQM